VKFFPSESYIIQTGLSRETIIKRTEEFMQHGNRYSCTTPGFLNVLFKGNVDFSGFSVDITSSVRRLHFSGHFEDGDKGTEVHVNITSAAHLVTVMPFCLLIGTFGFFTVMGLLYNGAMAIVCTVILLFFTWLGMASYGTLSLSLITAREIMSVLFQPDSRSEEPDMPCIFCGHPMKRNEIRCPKCQSTYETI
jgi:hypothetical protein